MSRTLLLLAAVLAFALAGCGGGSDDGGAGGDAAGTAAETADMPSGPLSVAAAKERGGAGLTVRGFVFVDGNDWRLCNSLEPSFPPLCIEPALQIANPDALAQVDLEEGLGQAGGLSWSERAVSLTGDVEGDAITVSEVATP